MQDEAAIGPDAAEPISEQPWRPSPQLQGRLLVGAGAVLLAGLLSAASSASDLIQGEKPGITLALVISWTAMLPQIWVLIAYLSLAREADSAGLWRSSLGLIGSLWLIQIILLSDETILPDPWTFVPLIVGGIGLLALIIYVLIPFAKGAGVTIFFGIMVGFRLLRHIPQFIPGLKELGALGVGLLVVGFLLIVAIAAIHLWLGVSLIKLQKKVGGLAALAGWTQLLTLAAFVGLLGWMAVVVSGAINQPNLTDEAFEELLKPHYRVLTLAVLASEIINASVTALMFLSIRSRGRGKPTWEFE